MLPLPELLFLKEEKRWSEKLSKSLKRKINEIANVRVPDFDCIAMLERSISVINNGITMNAQYEE